MAKLELPVRAYVEDFVKQAFPAYDFSRGSGINDLVIKPMAALLQPLRNEIDCIKIGQSINNYMFMRRADMDALAANWGKFRQSGSLSMGTVRIYFNVAANYTLNYIEFYALDGTTFVLSSPVVISAAQLIAQQQSTGVYYFDVQVQSVGVGNKYALPAGSIVGIKSAPAGITSVTNLQDFVVTAPDETNYDVANAMFKQLGMRNLVSKASIRAPLLDSFAGIVDIYIAGANDSKMLRDLQTVTIGGQLVTIHLGGMVDIWLNTSAVVQQQVTLTYLPSSGIFKIVSEAQAQQNKLLYAFSTSLLSIEGRYAAQETLDESHSVFFSMAGVSSKEFVLGTQYDSLYQLGQTDEVSGVQLIALPTPDNAVMRTVYVTDLLGLYFNNTNVAAGQYITCQDPQVDNSLTTVNGLAQPPTDSFRKIIAMSGNVLQLGPPVTSMGFLAFDDNSGTLEVKPGAVYLPNTFAADINDTVVFPPIGFYRVLGVDAGGFYFGNVIGQVALTYNGTDAGVHTYTITGDYPLDLDPTCWVYNGTNGGYTGLNSDGLNKGTLDTSIWFQILSIDRTNNTITTQGGVASNITAQFIQGLGLALASGAPVYFEEASDASINRSTRELFGTDSTPAPAGTGHTKYVNVVDTNAAVLAGSNVFYSLGLGTVAEVGDLLIFNGGNIPQQFLSVTGGDGTKFSVFITAVVDDDTVEFGPLLPFDIPANTAFVLMRNHAPVASVTKSSTLGNTLTVASWPLGLGDGTGMGLQDNNGARYTILGSTAGQLRTLFFNPPASTINITMQATGYITASDADIGAVVTQQIGNNIFTGTLFAYNNVTRVWSVTPNLIGTDLFQASLTSPVVIANSPATGFASSVGSPYATGYFSPSAGDIGKLVRQSNYTGLLESYDNTSYTWQVKPLSNADLFDIVNTTDVFVDYGTGSPSPTQGWGTLRQAASSPVVNSGTVTLTLDNPFTGTSANVYSRFGLGGGFWDGQLFKVLNDTNWNSTPFPSVEVGDNLCVLLGSNAGQYGVSVVNTFNLQVLSSQTPDFVRLANAPGPQPFPNNTTIALGATTLGFSGSGMGVWAQHGRILILSTSTAEYHLAIDGPGTADTLTLIDPVPAGISGTTIMYEIVEGYFSPFFNVLDSNFMDYRIIAAPELGDVLLSGTTGSKNAGTGALFDQNVSFSDVFAGVDLSDNSYLLYIDSGADASTVPVIITEVVNAITLLTNGNFTATENNVSYHIVHLNTASSGETWFDGTITNATQIHLTDAPVGWDYANYGTDNAYEIIVQPNSASLSMWSVPILTGTYDPVTQVLTVNVAAGTVRSANPGSFVVGTGFSGIIGQSCRVMIRKTDRAAEHKLAGQVASTYNYYGQDYFSLPIVNVQNVQRLNAETMQVVEDLNWNFIVNNAGTRYSANEDNSIQITNSDAILQPILVTYLADISIEAVNSYINADDTRVLNANQMAKRAETLAVDISLSVRTTQSETAILQLVSLFVNTFPMNSTLSVDQLVQYLYAQNAVSYVDIGSLLLGGTYYSCDGTVKNYAGVTQLFGSSCAAYIARNISVTLLSSQVGN